MDSRGVGLKSGRDRRVSDTSFNQNLIQNMDRSRLVESVIVEPLKFNGKEKAKNNKLEDEINRAASGIFGTPIQSPHTDVLTKHSMIFPSSNDSNRHGSNPMYSSNIRFRETPKDF